MTKRIKDDEYIRQVRMRRKKQEDQDSQAIKSSVLVLVVAMLVIVGIFGLTLFKSAKNPKSGGKSISSPAAVDLSEESPTPTETVKIPVLPDDPVEDVSPEPTEIPTDIDDSPAPAATEIPTTTPTEIPSGGPDIPEPTDDDDPDIETGKKPVIKPTSKPAARITISRPLIRPVIPGIAVPKIDFASAAMVGMKPPAPRNRPKSKHPSGSPGSAVIGEDPGDVDDDPPPPDSAYIIIYQPNLEGAQAFLWDNRSNKRLMLRFEKISTDKHRAAVPPGSYTMRIVKTDYKPYNTKFELKSGKKMEIEQPLEKAGRATLFVTSIPNGATIYLDGKPAGATPANITGLENRRYNIRLTKAGYKPVMSTIVLSHARKNSKKLFLAPVGKPKRKR